MGAGLGLARTWYLLVGAGALLLTIGHTSEAVAAGSRFDAPLVAAGVVVGILAIAAAAWVVAGGGLRLALAWLGIVAGFAPLAVALWIAATTASLDAQALVGVPTIIGFAAGVRMAVARLREPGAA